MASFILTDKDGQIKDRDMLDLYDGYLSLNHEVKFFKEQELYMNPKLISNNDIFGGHVNICRQIWKNNGISEPYLDCYPTVLKDFYGRNIHKMTFGKFSKLFDDPFTLNAYFAKPLKNKLFTGKVFYNFQDTFNVSCSNKTEVYVSSVVNFGAEFRAYVFNNRIVDVFRYWGDDWAAVIDRQAVETMVKLLVGSVPCFYSLDFGTDDRGRTLLIEINDGYALGNYGLGPKEYAEMTACRCKEIVSAFQKV